MLDPRKLNSLLKAGKFTDNGNIVGLTQKVFIEKADAEQLISDNAVTTDDLLLTYDPITQDLKKYNHVTSTFEDLTPAVNTPTNTYIDFDNTAWHAGAANDIITAVATPTNQRFSVDLTLDYHGQTITARATASETFDATFPFSRAFNGTDAVDFATNGNGDMHWDVVFDRPVRLHMIEMRGRNINEYFNTFRGVGYATDSDISAGRPSIMGASWARAPNNTQYATVFFDVNKPVRAARIYCSGGTNANPGPNRISIKLADQLITVPPHKKAMFSRTNPGTRGSVTLAYNVRSMHDWYTVPTFSVVERARLQFWEPIDYKTRIVHAWAKNSVDGGWTNLIHEIDNGQGGNGVNGSYPDSDLNTEVALRETQNNTGDTHNSAFTIDVEGYTLRSYADVVRSSYDSEEQIWQRDTDSDIALLYTRTAVVPATAPLDSYTSSSTGVITARTPTAAAYSIKAPNNRWQTSSPFNGAAEGSTASVYFGGLRTPENISAVSIDTNIGYASSGFTTTSVSPVGGNIINTISTGTVGGNTDVGSQTIGGLTYNARVILTGSNTTNRGKLVFPRVAGRSYEYEFWGNYRVDSGAFQTLFGVTSNNTAFVDDWSVTGNVTFVCRRNNTNTSITIFQNGGANANGTSNNIAAWNHYRVGIYWTSGTVYQVRVWQNNTYFFGCTLNGANSFALGQVRDSTDSQGTAWFENIRVREGVTDPGAVNWTPADPLFGSNGNNGLNNPVRTAYWSDTVTLTKSEFWIKNENNIWVIS